MQSAVTSQSRSVGLMSALSDSPTPFSLTPVAQRDLARFTATCRAPGSANAVATSNVADNSLARVLVIDGRCYCKNNGIGNLFGDYVVWFTTAALTGRALFIDWTDSTEDGSTNVPPRGMHKNQTLCMASGRGYACPRVPRRFDLGTHFETSGGREWRWSSHARAAVAARHGARAEKVLLTAPPPNALRCDDITSELLGPAPWLTLRLSDATATAMVPHCIGLLRPRPVAKAGRAPPAAAIGVRSWPDTSAVSAMLTAFAKHLRAAGHERAASDVQEAADGNVVGGRRLGSTLWSSPLAAPRSLRTPQRLRRYVETGDAAEASSSSLRSGELGMVSGLAMCAMHAMLRPRKALAKHLTPLLGRFGRDAVVTLQLRSGWADDSLHLGPRVAHELAKPPSELRRSLHRRFEYMRLLRRGADGKSAPLPPHVRRAWPQPLASHLYADNAARMAMARWATLTSTPCMASDPASSVSVRDSPCLDPSPAYLDAAARAFLRAKPDRAVAAAWKVSAQARLFRARVPRPVDLPGANSSKFAQVVRCAANLAQSIAFERVVRARRARRVSRRGERNGTAGGEGGGIEEAILSAGLSIADVLGSGDGGRGVGGRGVGGSGVGGGGGWQLYVSSDSPGLRATLEHLPPLNGRVTGCFPLRCTHAGHQAGQWRTPSADETIALAADLWMFGAADAAIAASSTTLTYWASRAPPRDGRPQLLNSLRGASPAPNLGNKMVPLCPPVTAGGRKCFDAEPNYERFPQQLRPPPNLTSGDDCFALRFSLMSESAAHAIAHPEPMAAAGGLNSTVG